MGRRGSIMGRIKIKKQNYKGKREVIWIWLAAISMTIYILWRGFCTIPNHAVYGWLAAICGIILLSAEAISMLEGIGHFFSSRKKSVPDKPVIPIGWYPHIDVFIATHNEDVELLYKTVNGCRHMRNGTMPKTENTTHTRAVSKKPSRLPMS